MVFSEVVFPDYMVELHRPYTPIIMPQGLKTGASTAAAIVDRQCALTESNCYVGQASIGETLRLDLHGIQERVRNSMGMFGEGFPFTGWTARTTVDPFLWNAVPDSDGQIITVVRDPAERMIAAWEFYRKSRGVFDMDLGDFIEKAYYDEDFREKLALPQYAALDAISRELVGKGFPYGTEGFAERFGEHVGAKVLSGEWLLMVADRFEESVYTYMRKAYGFEWHEIIHDTPKYRSTDELMSTLTSDQVLMLEELQPYDYLLYVAANVYLDTWQYRLMNYMEHDTMWSGDDDDDTGDDDDDDTGDDDDDNGGDDGDDDDNYYYDDDGDDDNFDEEGVDCDFYRWAVSNGYIYAYFTDDFDTYNLNYESTGGYDQMSVEYCFLEYMQENIEDTCDSDVSSQEARVKHEHRGLQQTHAQINHHEEEGEEFVPFMAFSKSARNMLKKLEASGEKSEGLANNISKLKKSFGKLTVDAKASKEVRKQSGSLSKAGSVRTSAVVHKKGLGSSKTYEMDNLASFEKNMCTFYAQNHRAMVSYSQIYHNPQTPEDMSGYITNEVVEDYYDY